MVTCCQIRRLYIKERHELYWNNLPEQRTGDSVWDRRGAMDQKTKQHRRHEVHVSGKALIRWLELSTQLATLAATAHHKHTAPQVKPYAAGGAERSGGR